MEAGEYWEGSWRVLGGKLIPCPPPVDRELVFCWHEGKWRGVEQSASQRQT